MVRFVCGRCPIEPISGGKISWSLVETQLVCWCRLRRRIYGHASPCRLAPRLVLSASRVQPAHALVQKLGLPRFHFVGHDIGCWIGYTYASQYAGTLRGVTLMEAAVPGISPGGAYAFTAEQAKKTWHFFFNCLRGR